MSDRQPLRFVFGVHLHQPVGNFDHVMAQHVRDVYRPFIERAVAARFLPLTIHISGPLLDWLEGHETAYLDLLGRLAADGHLEFLLSGFDEPILASLPRPDRLEQIGRMAEYVARRFGPRAARGGMWLTERVWQPDLVEDLAAAGITYTLVDDRHFLASGFRPGELHRPYRTVAGNSSVALLAIDERLRYLIPFGAPAETAAYLRKLRAAGHPLAVLADDGEKFGGWPGTQNWVYERGWLASFFKEMEQLMAAGEIALTTGAQAVQEVSSGGLAYLGTASYREMEKWALPAEAQQDFEQLEHDIGEWRLGEVAQFVRGGQWMHFLVKYPEANRMHKTMIALSSLSRDRGDPPAARRAIGRAQCNDAYWHGVFGGLYLPHLRHSIWHHLALAERELRQGEPLVCDVIDIDGDGLPELWVHSSHFSAIVSPHRGGAVETLLRFGDLVNLVDVLTRRREAYHIVKSKPSGGEGAAARSIHDLEREARLDSLPPVDHDTRALFLERVLPGALTAEAFAEGRYTPLASWTDKPMTVAVSDESGEGSLVIALTASGLEKRLRFDVHGGVQAAYRWDPAAFPHDAVFTTELSLAQATPLSLTPGDVPVWRQTITTVARSERGFEETVQGTAFIPRWPVRLGEGACNVELELASALARP